MNTHPDRLRVFISSRMHELEDLRAILRRQLEMLGIGAFVYEADQGAHPNDPEQVSLHEVERTDIFVLVIGESYGEITEREYDRARDLSKPCLVYERLGTTTTEGELQRFLKKLSGPRGVPSRTTFRNAVDLAEKLAKDVQAWLVREYRRLSAAQLMAGESSRRKTELEGNIQRLSASTNQSLPSGNSADLLAWRLQEWLEALEYPLDLAPESHGDWTDLLVRVPARRRQYTRVLVRAKDGEIQSPDVDAARKAAAEQSLDQVWLVSFRRISPAARKAVESHTDVFLYTLDDLIEEDVDFGRYFDWLDHQVQTANIDRLYVPLAVTVNEVDPSGALQAASKYDNIASYVDQWLEDTDGEHLSLLGEFGTGKSWFALKYAHDMVRRYRDAQQRGLKRPRVPLVVRLREYGRGFKDVGSLLTEFVFREHQINIRSFAALETLNRMGRLLFIFDGFDEMAARVDQQKMVDNFWSLAAVLGRGSKAILTCRTEYFHFAKQAREILSGKLRASLMRESFEATRFQVATLQMFDEQRLRKVLSCRSDDETLIDVVLSNQKLFDLGRRPVMVDLLIEAMPNLEADHADLAQVYYQAVQRKMARDITLGRTFTSMADKIFFMCEISWEMLSTHQLKINYKQIPDRIREYFGSRVATAEEDHWRHDLLSQTMLVRDDDGYYQPAHKSLIEFFSAYKLAAAIGALKDEYVEAARGHANVDEKLHPSGQRWSSYFHETASGMKFLPPLARFAKESIEQLDTTWGRLSLDDATRELIFLLCGQQALFDFVKNQNLSDDKAGSVAARVLEVSSFSRDLREVDLSGAVVSGCCLQNCDLSSANLSGSTWNGGNLELISLDGASLRGARFRKIKLVDATFRGADLSNSCFEGVQFQVNVVGAVWCTREDEEILITVLADGRIAAIRPLALKVRGLDRPAPDATGKTAEELMVWLSNLSGVCEMTSLGQVFFTRNGWQRNSAWENRELAEGLKSKFLVGWAAGGDVETLEICVTIEKTEEVLLSHKLFDATGLRGSNQGTRALAISNNGRRIAVISGKESAKEEAKILGQNSQAIALHAFSGSTFSLGPETIDRRGAAFSPSESLLGICEQTHTIGFWRTENGEFAGRVVFSTAGRGCIVDGAVGLPPTFMVSISDEHDGWTFEGPI